MVMSSSNVDHIGKYLKITLENKCEVDGVCFTVDPITKTVILITSKDSHYESQMILSHAVIQCDDTLETPEAYQSDAFKEYLILFEETVFGVGSDKVDANELKNRQEKLIKWLELNHLPVSIVNDNILSVVNGVATIEPPYTVEACRSTNTIVLDRLMKLVESCSLDD